MCLADALVYYIHGIMASSPEQRCVFTLCADEAADRWAERGCVDWVMLNLPSPLLTRPVRVRECSNEICVIYVFITLHITDRCWLKED